MSDIKKYRVIHAEYDAEKDNIKTLIDVDGRKCTFPLSRDLFSYGNRTEEEIVEELKKTAHLLKNKFIAVELPEDGFAKYDEMIDTFKKYSGPPPL